MTPAPAFPIMVLAHNEEERIVACLDSIFSSEAGARFEVYVLANGCTDRTEDIVRKYAGARPGVHLVSIARADKCNAWNVFIHEVVPGRCPGREVYFFTNGDVRIVPGSFEAMTRTLRAHPRAHAASAVPASGRTRDRDRERVLREHGLMANLYSLRGSFVGRLGKLSVRMPLNLEGDDGLIGALTKWNLAPDREAFDDERIVPCADAAFAFESMSPFRLLDWGVYWKRAVRYGRRGYEFELLRERLKKAGLAALPADITELYHEAGKLRLRWQGIYTLASLVALRQMRRIGNRGKVLSRSG
jgi:glycosyltransferase involved in cell wall biosynthesis